MEHSDGLAWPQDVADGFTIRGERYLTGQKQLRHDQYYTLAEFRYLLRRFLDFSEAAARDSGLSPTQHQALLAIKGFHGNSPPTVGELAERLCIRHHSAVELVDRLEAADLLQRRHDSDDRRRVKLILTPTAEAFLRRLSATHLGELRRLKPTLQEILDRIDELT